jgi:hypothetical protein
VDAITTDESAITTSSSVNIAGRRHQTRQREIAAAI